jgi:hypothetical protein
MSLVQIYFQIIMLTSHNIIAALFVDNVKGRVTPPQPKANCINNVSLPNLIN